MFKIALKEMVKLGMQDTINWKAIEKEVASTFEVKQDHVTELRQQFLIAGKVIVRKRVAAEVMEEAMEEAAAMCRSKLLLRVHLLCVSGWTDSTVKVKL